MDKGNAGTVNEIEPYLKIVSPGSLLSYTKELRCKPLQKILSSYLRSQAASNEMLKLKN